MAQKYRERGLPAYGLATVSQVRNFYSPKVEKRQDFFAITACAVRKTAIDSTSYGKVACFAQAFVADSQHRRQAGFVFPGVPGLMRGRAGFHRGIRMPRRTARYLVERIFENFARAKFDNLARRDGERVPGAGVAALPGLAVFHCECAETGKREFGFLDKSVFDRSEKGIEGPFGSRLGQIGLGSYFFDKISLSHQHVLLKGSPALFQAAFLAMKKPEGIQRSKIMDRLKTFYALLSSCEAQKAAIRWKSEHVRASGRKAGSMQASCRDFSRPGCAARRNTPPSCLRRC